jgi:hypothetical protein
MAAKNTRYLLPLAVLALALSAALGRILAPDDFVDFLAGLLLGLAVALSVAHLLTLNR